MKTLETNVDQIRNLTRTGGILYLVLIICGMYAELFVLGDLVVGGDATVTANNIRSHEGFYRTGIIAHIVTIVSGLILMGILFMIFKSTSLHLAITAVIFNTVALALEGVSILYELEMLSIVKSRMLATVFTADQIDTLAYQPLKMQTIGYDLALLFFGVVCCLNAALILKSKLFLRWIGFVLLLAGVCYITNSLVSYIAPAIRNYLLPFILVPCLVAELSLSINMIANGKRKR